MRKLNDWPPWEVRAQVQQELKRKLYLWFQFQKCFTLNCSTSKLHWSKDNCIFFLGIEDLALSSRSCSGQFPVFLSYKYIHDNMLYVYVREREKEEGGSEGGRKKMKIQMHKWFQNVLRELLKTIRRTNQKDWFILSTHWLYFFRVSR